jgi:hypothetical protein
MFSNKQDSYTVQSLKIQYKTFKEAKQCLRIKANSWISLVDKLNSPSYDQLKEQVTYLSQELENLKKENIQLKQAVAKNDGFDEVGFWLLDNNFDRSKFSDFGVPQDAKEMESAAKEFYKKLAKIYHPDKGGTEMQMANLNRLLEQMMVLVDMNGGLGL